MTISETSIKIFASERLNDDTDGGGFMGSTVVIDGVENNLFNDVSAMDRSIGRFSLRKIYPAVVTSTLPSETYLGAHILVDDVPADPGATAVMFKIGDHVTQRLAAAVYTNTPGYSPYTSTVYLTTQAIGAIGDTSIQLKAQFVGGSSYVPSTYFAVGATITLVGNGIRFITAVSYNSGTFTWTLTFAGQPLVAAVPSGGLTSDVRLMTPNYAARYYTATPTTASAAIGDYNVAVGSVHVRVAPMIGNGAFNSSDPALIGFTSGASWVDCGGYALSILAGDLVVIHHTATEAPQTVSNGQDINLGRTNLAEVRVYGNDGIRITTGFSVNKATGHIVFSAVGGYSQPVTITHRIEDLAGVQSVALYPASITLNKPLTHAYPSGTSRVSAALVVGDMQARARTGFQQATWTSVFSDTIIGSGISADYNEPANPIQVTNAGGIKERWALQFTNTTTFNIIGEQVGIIGTGNTGATCAPINPATGSPYFSIPAAGWGSGWAVGNTYRFNTEGANLPVWVGRSVAPSEPFVGQDKVTIAVRGSIDA